MDDASRPAVAEWQAHWPMVLTAMIGMTGFGAIFGLVGSLMMFGSATGSNMAGLVYDQTGNYTLPLMTAIPVVLLASFMFVGLGRYPDFKPSEELPEDAAQPARAE